MDDDLGPLRESQEIAISGEVCLEVGWHPTRDARAGTPVRGIFLSAFIYFLARSDLNSEISNLKSFGVFELEI